MLSLSRSVVAILLAVGLALVVVTATADDTPPVKDTARWGDRDRTDQIVMLWEAIEKLSTTSPDVDELLDRITELDDQLELIRATPITVQIVDPQTNAILVQKSYPYGSAIRLMLPEQPN